MRHASAPHVRALIAHHVLGARYESPTLGTITLYPHQALGARRILRMLEHHGGALLADDVGLGKTYVALAVARHFRDVCVLAPAALRPTWRSAASRAGVSVRFVSLEMLARSGAPPWNPELVVIDEAHRVRSPATLRFRAASRLTRAAKVLLITATPVQNRLEDLRVILSIFLGARAMAASAADLSRYIVRRVERDVASENRMALPAVAEPRWLAAPDDVDCLDRIAALPPPLPPADGGDGGALLTFTLLRQWSSSRQALTEALKRRIARARAMEDALASGRLPTRRELSAWVFADGVQQLAFPELLAVTTEPDASRVLARVRAHTAAVRDLLRFLDVSPDVDVARADLLRGVLARHPGERVIAFSEYADTVAVLFRLLRPTTRVAMLTHAGGRVAGGPMTRADVLRCFSPDTALSAAEHIDLLLATDVLSEGVDLHAASVVVHLDLAWNPARLEQRVGRLRRVGAPQPRVAVYACQPPAPAERLLRMERRLRVKLGVAARSVGVAGAILPGIVTSHPGIAATRGHERVTAALESWRGDLHGVEEPAVAAVRSSGAGAIACVRVGDEVTLLALHQRRVLAEHGAVASLMAHASDEECAIDAAAMREAVEAVERWMQQQSIAGAVGSSSLRVARSRRQLLRRIDGIARHMPRHAQPALAPLVRSARLAATVTLSAGAERVLDELARASLPDQAWLHAMHEFSALHARSTAGPPRLLALLLLQAR